MSKPYRLGENAALYFSATALTAALTSASAMTLVPNVKDVKTSGKPDAPEYTTRANNGVKQYASSLKDLSVSFDLKVPATGTTDAAYSALQAAFIAGNEIAIAALTGPDDPGSEGAAGNFIVADWGDDQSNGKVIFRTVELKPSSFNSWYTHTGS